MSKYIAVTLGPIQRITLCARKTKELWASSYLFSYIGEQIVRPFFFDEKPRTFLLPFLFKEMFDTKNNRGIGVFPDRYIFKSEEGDFDKLQSECDKLYANLAKCIADSLKLVRETDEAKVCDYLKHTIKIYAFEKEFNDDENVTDLCEQILQSIENRDVYYNVEGRNYLLEFFQNVANTFLAKHANLDGQSRIFKTIREYSAAELRRDKEFSSDTKLDQNPLLRPYHNYIAFVKADGDGFSNTIRSLRDNNLDMSTFNQALYNYYKSLVDKVSEYGGRVIFNGGDDLLLFAPVKYKHKNIFSLIQEIDQIFQKEMSAFIKAPTLSFGLSMTYYKYPMSEAIQNAESLLSKAKKKGKNHLCWQLVKHSGKVYEASIDKANDEVLKQVIKLINQGMKVLKQKKTKTTSTEAVLNSYTYWLAQNKEVVMYILEALHAEEGCTQTDEINLEVKSKLKNYIDNSLNETIHSGMGTYENDLVEGLISFMDSYNNAETSIKLMCATLNFVGFLKSKRV